MNTVPNAGSHPKLHLFLRIILFILVLSVPLVYIHTIRNPVYWTQLKASVVYDETTDPGGGTAAPPTECANQGGGSCDAAITLNLPAGQDPPAVGSGYDWNGVHYKVVVNDGGKTWLEKQPPKDDKDGGARERNNYPTIITPTLPPTGGTGTVNAVALSSNTASLSTCTAFEQLKTCLDTPPGTGCNAQYLNGTDFYLSSQGPVRQTDSTGVRFSNVPSGYTWYLTAAYLTGNYSPYLFCNKTTTNPTYTAGNAVLMYPDLTADFLVGFVPALPWFQIKGGGNTFGDTIESLMPIMVWPTLLFDTSASPQFPGIVSGGLGGIDFSDSPGSGGQNNISSTNWNSSNALTPRDWYQFYSTRLQQAVITPYTGSGDQPSMPQGETTAVFKVNGDLTINDPWVIADGEKFIIIVDGTLDIRALITLTNPNTSFVAFIVRDDITVHSSVGTPWDSETPVVEGMYIAGGAIKTGTTDSVAYPAKERFVGKGIFAADQILTQRNLYSVVLNNSIPSDIFIYNPAFLVTMPDILKDLSYTWQEVAP